MPKLSQKLQDSSMLSCNSLIPQTLKIGTADGFTEDCNASVLSEEGASSNRYL